MNKQLIQKLKKLPFFTLDTIRSQTITDPLFWIKYYLKTSKIIRLKRGIYVFKDFVEKTKYQGKFEDYQEFLAGKFISPSYISLEYMLSKYAILTESPFTLTLLTTKTSRVVENPLGNFSYYNIKEKLFCGFKFIKKGEFEIKYATKAKALFDFLYFQKRNFRTVNKEIIDELRLNLDEMTSDDWKEFEKYLLLIRSKKMDIIFKFLRKND